MELLTQLTAKQDFAFRSSSKGKAVQVKAGQVFEVMTTKIAFSHNGYCLIARKGKGKLGIGHAFSPSMIAQFFEVKG